MNPIYSIIEEFKQQRRELEMPIEKMQEELKPFHDNVLLYGAGSSGIAFLYDLRKIGVEPSFFVDGNPQKKGERCEGIEVITPSDIKERVSADFLIIVCINTDGKRYCKSFDKALRTGGHHAVYDKLRKAGCKNIIDYTFFRRCFQIFKDEKYNAPSCSDVDLMVKHTKEIAQVYDDLEDDYSRTVFERIVRFRLLDDSIEIPTLPQENQYFENEIYQPKDDAVFVDCGAYNGNSFKTFLLNNGSEFSAYYGFEPDPENFKRLTEYKKTLPMDLQEKMIIMNNSVWRDQNGARLYSLGGPGSFIANDIGTFETRTISIDEVVSGRRVTYIKMNIEGSEKEALEGAKETIQKNKPGLAIAGYHRTDDLWEIPIKIKAYREDYQLYLRSYMNHVSFVYFAK